MAEGRSNRDPSPWSERDLADALENIRTAYWHFAEGFAHPRWERDDGLLLIDSGGPIGELNVAFVLAPPAHPEETVRRAADFFRRPGPWRLEAGANLEATLHRAALHAGLTEVEHRPALMLRPPTLPSRFPSPELEIRRVRSSEDARLFADVVSRGTGFALPPEMAEVPFHRLGPLRCFVAYQNGVPAACSMVHLDRGLAGIYAVATLEPYRRRGLAGALAEWSVREGVAEGCRGACLQSSAMGLPVYTGIGFLPAFDDVIWTTS